MTPKSPVKTSRQSLKRFRPTARTAVLIMTVAFTALSAPAHPVDSGSVWHDTDGHAINAHGGGLLQKDGTFFWYGEIKAGPTELPECNATWGGTRVPFAGVACYSSTDLAHWRYEGNALPCDPTIPDLRAERVVERPKVVFNAKTRQYVMWMHIDSADYHEARTGVAVAESPAGPFRYLGATRPDARVFPDDMPEAVRHEFKTAKDDNLLDAWIQRNPDWKIWARDFNDGQMARDMALFVDDDGTAYQFYASEENAVMHVSRLNADYLAHSGKYRRITFDSREAPAPFKWNGRYFLVSSGCTGWMPNPTRIHSASTVLGEWSSHGSFFADDTVAAAVSYLSQAAFVAVLGNDRLLYLADRWNKDDLENSRYVWLPIEVSSGTPRVRWRQVWDLEGLRPGTTP